MDDHCIACGFKPKQPGWLKETEIGSGQKGKKGYFKVTVCKSSQACQRRLATRAFHGTVVRLTFHERDHVEPMLYWLKENVRRWRRQKLNLVH